MPTLHSQVQNHLLAILPAAEFEPLAAHLELVRLQLGDMLYEPGAQLQYAYFPTTASSLAADYHKILDELRRRYIIGYESTNHTRDGRWRAVEIRAREKGVEIRSRGGYYAPPQ